MHSPFVEEKEGAYKREGELCNGRGMEIKGKTEGEKVLRKEKC